MSWSKWASNQNGHTLHCDRTKRVSWVAHMHGAAGVVLASTVCHRRSSPDSKLLVVCHHRSSPDSKLFVGVVDLRLATRARPASHLAVSSVCGCLGPSTRRRVVRTFSNMARASSRSPRSCRTHARSCSPTCEITPSIPTPFAKNNNTILARKYSWGLMPTPHKKGNAGRTV